MEIAKIEIAHVQEVVKEVSEQQIRELNELQLALIGGGSGDVFVG